MYIARDKDGSLYLFSEKPRRVGDSWRPRRPDYLFIGGVIDEEKDINNEYQTMIPLNPRAYPKITWEIEPVGLKLMYDVDS